MSTPDAAGRLLDGPEPRRVAEVLVTTAAGTQERGSGYLLDPRTVLTAAHVVRGAAAVEIRFEGLRSTEWTCQAAEILVPEQGDVAAVVLPPNERTATVRPVEFGRVEDRAAVVACQAVGFPRWKLRRDDQSWPAGPRDGGAHRYRDRAQAVGRIPVLSNSKEGTLEIITDPPEHDPDPDRSPWEGMSGAAVWVGDRIVGVISKHHRSDSPSRLAAARIDRWLSLPADAVDAVRAVNDQRIPPGWGQVIPPGLVCCG
jgi:hypothetical protein